MLCVWFSLLLCHTCSSAWSTQKKTELVSQIPSCQLKKLPLALGNAQLQLREQWAKQLRLLPYRFVFRWISSGTNKYTAHGSKKPLTRQNVRQLRGSEYYRRQFLNQSKIFFEISAATEWSGCHSTTRQLNDLDAIYSIFWTFLSVSKKSGKPKRIHFCSGTWAIVTNKLEPATSWTDLLISHQGRKRYANNPAKNWRTLRRVVKRAGLTRPFNSENARSENKSSRTQPFHPP